MKKLNLSEIRLFLGISEAEIDTVLTCLSARYKTYQKGDYIFRMGELITSVGVITEGSVQIMKEDYWGERQILSSLSAGQIFGESYACVQGEPLMVSVVATDKTEVLFLDMKKLLTVCSSTCVFHSKLIQNMLWIIASKNLNFTHKIDHMSKKNIREKVLSYLYHESNKQGRRTIQIPFNRQQLADYLAVDRSALSAELSKMQKEGLISFHRNQFTI